MRRIANYSKRLNVKLAIDALNDAKIFKQKIPYLKLHNRVPDKRYNNSAQAKVWLTIDDIVEHSKNPERVCNRLRFDEEHSKRYDQKTTEYQMEIDFDDELNLSKNYKKTAMIIKKYIMEKFNNLNTKEMEYELKTFKEEPWNDYGIYCNFHKEDGIFKYYVDMYLKIKKYDDTSYTEFYGTPTYFYIHIIKRKKGMESKKNYLKIYLDSRLQITLIVFV